MFRVIRTVLHFSRPLHQTSLLMSEGEDFLLTYRSWINRQHIPFLTKNYAFSHLLPVINKVILFSRTDVIFFSENVPKTAAQLKKEKARQAKLEKFQKKQEALKAKAAAQVNVAQNFTVFPSS